MAFWSTTRYEDQYSSETDDDGTTHHENLYVEVTTTHSDDGYERVEERCIRRNEWVSVGSGSKDYSAVRANEYRH